MPVSWIAIAAAFAAQNPSDPLSQLPPLTGDPRATSRERETLPPVPPPAVQPVDPVLTNPALALEPQEPAGTLNVSTELPAAPEPRLVPGPERADGAAPDRQSPPAAVSNLPQPTSDPLAIDRSADPILKLARDSVPPPVFIGLVRQAVELHPAVDESVALIAAAEAVEDRVKAGRYPTVDLGINGSTAILRQFEQQELNTVVERARARGRVDATINAEQTLFDWGATEARVQAASARLGAAALDAAGSANEVALRATAAWYDVFAYRALVALSGNFISGQGALREAIERRISQGVSAPGDLPRVESYIASAESSDARYRRLLANAEARFQEFFGVPAPADLGRAPILGVGAVSREMAQLLARATPEVRSAEAAARAAAREAKAERAAALPRISAGIDAGRYGVFQNDAYDVRGRLTIRQRLFGGIDAQGDEAEARALAAEARAARIRNQAEREAAVAWSDVQALQQQLAALENSYIASRQSRDVLAERFRVARGTLFDLLESESSYFNVAATYIRAITELDAARYALLSRTGKLLETLDIEAPTLEDM